MYLSLPGAEVGVADGGEEHLDADLQSPEAQAAPPPPPPATAALRNPTPPPLHHDQNSTTHADRAAPPSMQKSGNEKEKPQATTPLHLMAFPRVPPAPPFPFVMASSSS